jgi:hypothetical protein
VVGGEDKRGGLIGTSEGSSIAVRVEGEPDWIAHLLEVQQSVTLYTDQGTFGLPTLFAGRCRNQR